MNLYSQQYCTARNVITFPWLWNNKGRISLEWENTSDYTNALIFSFFKKHNAGHLDILIYIVVWYSQSSAYQILKCFSRYFNIRQLHVVHTFCIFNVNGKFGTHNNGKSVLFLMHEVIQIIAILANNYFYWHGMCNSFYLSMTLLLKCFGVTLKT